MDNSIFWKGQYVKVKEDLPPIDEEMLHSYLTSINIPSCFVNSKFKWYKIRENGTQRFVCNNLKNLSLRKWKNEALKKY